MKTLYIPIIFSLFILTCNKNNSEKLEKEISKLENKNRSLNTTIDSLLRKNIELKIISDSVGGNNLKNSEFILIQDDNETEKNKITIRGLLFENKRLPEYNIYAASNRIQNWVDTDTLELLMKNLRNSQFEVNINKNINRDTVINIVAEFMVDSEILQMPTSIKIETK